MLIMRTPADQSDTFRGLRRAVVGYYLAVVGAVGVMVGGIFDQLVPRLLPSHEAFLGVAPGAASPQVSAMVLLLLHTLGASLTALGLTVLALLVAWRRTGIRWMALAAAAATLLAEGVNAYGIFRVGSQLFWGPLAIMALVIAGVAIALTAPVPVSTVPSFRPDQQVQESTRGVEPS